MTPDERQAALERCLERSQSCSDDEKNAIVLAAEGDEQNRLRAIAAARSPTAVSFDELHKLAATGMPVAKPYKVCAYYYPNDLPQLCKHNGTYCENYLSVGDNLATGSPEKKQLYDRRGRTSCFEVRMFSDGELRITGLL
jgi:hypothetical protein